MMKKIYSKPTLAYFEVQEADIMTVSVGQVFALEEGENELGNWWME
jgi:hypothetical protein